MRSMHERWTDRARKVMRLAIQETLRFNHEAVDTHHVLLALIKESTGVAGNVLKQFTSLPALRCAVAELFPPGNDFVGMGHLLETDEVRLAMEDAFEWMRKLGHTCVGTEHLLLGLLERENNAMRVLRHLKILPEDVRQETLSLLGHGPGRVMPEESLAYVKMLFPFELVNVFSVACTHAITINDSDPRDNVGQVVVSLYQHALFVELFARCARGSG